MSRRLASTAVRVAPGPAPVAAPRPAEPTFAAPPRPTVAAPERASSGIGYIAGLDGVRAISVIAVLLFHGDFGWAQGGYLGVEVFFVISGFLITSLLLAEHKRTGGTDLPHFWLRRARRLLPAMFAVVAASLLVAGVLVRQSLDSLRGDAVSAVLYVTNWTAIVGDKSYGAKTGQPQLLEHLWSLAVEEQFYLVWPLLFAGGMKVFGRQRFVRVVAMGAAASAIGMAVVYNPDLDAARNRAYLGTDTRATGLLLGCLLAFVWVPGRIRQDRAGQHAGLLLDGLGVLALVGIGWMMAAVNLYSPFLYRGGFVVLSALTAILIAAVVHPSARLGRLLGVGPLRWLGLRSYGIYLWHYPVFQLTSPQYKILPEAFRTLDLVVLFALRLGVTLVLAAVSYRYLELPIRQGALGRTWKALRATTGEERSRLRQRWLIGWGSVAVTIGAVAIVALTAPPPSTESTDLAMASASGSTLAVAAFDPSKLGDFRDPNAVADPFADRSTSTTAEPTTTPSTEATTVGSGPGGSTPDTLEPPTTDTTAAPPPTEATLPRLAPALAGKKIALLGDSVMLGASPSVTKVLGPNAVVSAQQNRQVSDGITILRGWAGAGWLMDAEVVIHLGNNGTFFDNQFDEIMEVLKDAPRVVFVNVRVPRPWQDSVNDTIRRGTERYPANTVFVDWYAFSEGQGGWFYDGMHLDQDGAPEYAELLASAL